MSRRVSAVALLAALVMLTSAVPGLPGRAVAASCSGWTSQEDPPPTIRVFRHATGDVETVNLKPYTKNVLSREWIGSWTTESLRSGALAVKHYAWYQVLHWRGGTNADGECFDIRDDTADQVYDPSKPVWTTAAAAVNATWTTRVLKNGQIFPTYYNAGSPGEACGANANGWKMYQWGTQACGLDGKTAAQIVLTYYYPNVTVVGDSEPPPTATPSPTSAPTSTPKPTPKPTATPSPAPSAPGATATPRPSRTPRPTPSPTPPPSATPAPTPDPGLATPPPDQQLPGGGQTGIVDDTAPPPPPPDDPEPVVTHPARTHRQHQAASPVVGPVSLPRLLAGADPTAAASGALWPAYRLVGMHAPQGSSPEPRMAAFAALWRTTLDELVERLLQRFAWQRSSVVGFARLGSGR